MMDRRKFLGISGLILGGAVGGVIFRSGQVPGLSGALVIDELRARPGDVVEAGYRFGGSVIRGNLYWVLSKGAGEYEAIERIGMREFHGEGNFSLTVPPIRSENETEILELLFESEGRTLFSGGDGLEVVCGRYMFGM